MARKTLEKRPNKEQSLLQSGAGNSGNGNDLHAPIRADGHSQLFRELVRFNVASHEWADMYQIVEARLYLRTTGGVHIGSGNWRNGSLRISRVTEHWQAGGGSEGWWTTTAPTVWPGPSVAGDHIDRSWPTTPNNWVDRDITAHVESWAPATVLKSNGQPGDGRPNEGLRLAAQDGLWIEYHSMRGTQPQLRITYDTSVPPTAAFVSPDPTFGLVRVVNGEEPQLPLGMQLEFSYQASDGDQLTRAEWVLYDDTELGAKVGQGELPLEGGTALLDLFPEDPDNPGTVLGAQAGHAYRFILDLTAQDGGANLYEQRFTYPLGTAEYATRLGTSVSNVGASAVTRPVIPGTLADLVVTHYAQSLTPDASGIVGGWSSQPPAAWPGTDEWWLLTRTRIWRRTAGYQPLNPEGLDTLTITWRGAG